jgi:hypothetical protein
MIVSHPSGSLFAFTRSAEVVSGGFATPHRLTTLPGSLSGCIYRSDGSKVALSERFGGYMGDYVTSDNLDRVSRPPGAVKLRGRGLYLGHWMAGHYGHFVTEGLSAFWIFEQQPARNFDFFLFHPFVFGDGRPDYVRFSLGCFDIPESRIVVVGSSPVVFEELIVPERLVRLNHSGDRRLAWVYRVIAEKAAEPPSPNPLLYLSRRMFSRASYERVVANEVCVEAAFRRRGFDILYPERMRFEDQVARYSRAEIIAGISGSGLHNSLFMRSGRLVVELGDPRYGGQPAPTQAVCNAISGVRSVFIPFVGRRFGPSDTMVFDTRLLEGRLAVAVGHVGVSPSPPEPVPLWRSFRNVVEVAYMSIRPAVGHVSRRFIRRRSRRSPPARSATP